MITEYAISDRIDIHPEGSHWERLLHDHGPGIVIGNNRYGDMLKILPGVTLGALFVKKSLSIPKGPHH